MKEKTFEELLTDDNDFAPENFTRNQVLKLLQQVREATIEECEEIAFNNLDFQSCEDVRHDLYNLPTDRITLKD